MDMDNTTDTLATTSYDYRETHYGIDNSSKKSSKDLSLRRSDEFVDDEEQFYDAHGEILSQSKTVDQDDIEQSSDTEYDSHNSSSSTLTKSRHHRPKLNRMHVDNFHEAITESDNNSESEVHSNARENSVVEQEAADNELSISTNGEMQDYRINSCSKNISIEKMNSGSDNNDQVATNNEKVEQNGIDKSDMDDGNKVDNNEDKSSVCNGIETYAKNGENSTTSVDNVEKFTDHNDDNEGIDKIVSDAVENILKNAAFSSDDDEMTNNVTRKKYSITRRSSNTITVKSDLLALTSSDAEVETEKNIDQDDEIRENLTASKLRKIHNNLPKLKKLNNVKEWESIDACYQCQVVVRRINVDEELKRLNCTKSVNKRNNLQSKRKQTKKQSENEDNIEIINDINTKPTRSYFRGRHGKMNALEEGLSQVAEENKVGVKSVIVSNSGYGQRKMPQKKPSRIAKLPVVTTNDKQVTMPNRMRNRREKTPETLAVKPSRAAELPIEEVTDKDKVTFNPIQSRRLRSSKTTENKLSKSAITSISTGIKDSSDEEMVTNRVPVKPKKLPEKKSSRDAKFSSGESKKQTRTKVLSRKRALSPSTLLQTKSITESTATENEMSPVGIGDRFVTGVCLTRMSAKMIKSCTKSSFHASNSNSERPSRAKSSIQVKRMRESTDSGTENVTKFSSDEDFSTKRRKTKCTRNLIAQKHDSAESDVETTSSRTLRKKVVPPISQKDSSDDSDIDMTFSRLSKKKVVSTCKSRPLLEKSSVEESKILPTSREVVKMQSSVWQKSYSDGSDIEIKSKAQKKIYSDWNEVEKPPVRIKITSDESLWEKFIQSESKLGEKSVINEGESQTKSCELNSNEANTESVKEIQLESINFSSSDEENAVRRLNSSRISSKSPERSEGTKYMSATRSRRYFSSSDDKKTKKNSDDWCESRKLKPREAKTKSKMKLNDAFSDEESDTDTRRKRESSSSSSDESDWELKAAKEECADSSDESSSNCDEGWKPEKSKGKIIVQKKRTKSRSKSGRKSNKPNKKEETLKNMAKLCGFRISSYNEFWGDCETIEEKTQRMHEFLREKGLKDEPTLRNCEEFGFARRGLTLVDSGSMNSDEDDRKGGTKYSESSEEERSVHKETHAILTSSDSE